jgi:hypothetical protein
MQDDTVIRTLDKAQRKYVLAQTGLDTPRIRNNQVDFNLGMRRVKACNLLGENTRRALRLPLLSGVRHSALPAPSTPTRPHARRSVPDIVGGWSLHR